MKKLLFIPLDYQYKPYQEFYESFCKKFETLYYSDNERAINFSPDYVYVHSCAITPEKLSEIKTKTGAIIVQLTGNVRADVLPDVIAYKDVCDLTLLAAGIGQREMYVSELRHPVKYFQHHVSNWQYIQAKELTSGKIIFIGNAYHQFEGAVERGKLCELLTTKFEQFEVWGNGFALPQFRNPSNVSFDLTQPMYNDAYISISANCFNDIEGYYSDRPLHIMAAGGCCLMRYIPSLENWFTDMEHCVFYRDNDEAVEKINMLIANPELRNKVAKQGQEHVMRYHHNDYRVIQLMKYLGL